MYRFGTNIADSDPGGGYLKFNSATPASVTHIYIDDQDMVGAVCTGFFATWDDSTNTVKGNLSIRAANSTLNLQTYNLTAVSAKAGYYDISVTPVVTSTLPTIDLILSVNFSRAGDAGTSGTSGSAGSHGTSGTSGLTGSSGTSGTSGTGVTSGTSGTSAMGLSPGDSPVFVTVKLSSLTDGYVPYHSSDAVGLVNSPIYTDGTSIGIGHIPAAGSPILSINPALGNVDTALSKITVYSSGANNIYGIGLSYNAIDYGLGLWSGGTTTGAPRVFINGTNGNVGIGVYPTERLHVYGVAADDLRLVLENPATGGYGTQILFKTKTVTTDVVRTWTLGTGVSGGVNSFELLVDGASVPSICATVAGNVGIGITPACIFHVSELIPFNEINHDTILINGERFNSGDNTKPSSFGSLAWKSGGYYFGRIECVQTNPYSYWTNRMAFSTMNGDGGSLLERMCIDNTGNVGIGRINPRYRLEVSVPFPSTDVNYNTIAFFGSNDASNEFGLEVAMIGSVTDASRKMLLQATTRAYSTIGQLILNCDGGAVGIGVLNPTSGYKLDIGGHLRLSGTTPIIVGHHGLTLYADPACADVAKLIMLEDGNCEVGGMGRFKGWISSYTSTGLAVEVGVAGGAGYINCYDRTGLSYGVLTIQGPGASLTFPSSGASLTINGGLHVGGTSDPGDNNLLVDGTVESLGAFICTKANPYIKLDQTGTYASTWYLQVNNSATKALQFYNSTTGGLVEISPAGDVTVPTLRVTTGAAAGKVLSAAGTSGSASWDYAGRVLQVANYTNGSAGTGTTVIPRDDTIPQNTEGDEFMKLAFTPLGASNMLRIKVLANAVCGGAAHITMALFRNNEANALATAAKSPPSAGYSDQLVIDHYMTAGTAGTAGTFKVRMGTTDGSATYFNCIWGGGRGYGGNFNSIITIEEIKV
jgi:hypothetical protein